MYKEFEDWLKKYGFFISPKDISIVLDYDKSRFSYNQLVASVACSLLTENGVGDVFTDGEFIYRSPKKPLKRDSLKLVDADKIKSLMGVLGFEDVESEKQFGIYRDNVSIKNFDTALKTKSSSRYKNLESKSLLNKMRREAIDNEEILNSLLEVLEKGPRSSRSYGKTLKDNLSYNKILY